MYPNEEILLKAILIASVVIGAILLYFLFIQVRQQRLFRLLNAAKIAGEIQTLENERKRMAADVHDDLGPLLSSTRLMLESVDSCSEADKVRLDQSIQLVDDLLKRVRRIANDLLPEVLAEQGLAAAVNDFIKMFPPAAGLRIYFTCWPGLTTGNTTAIQLFRIVQEIVHNTVKHARAKKLHITITRSGAVLQLLSADDGDGFVWPAGEPCGRGLQNIQNRVALLQGEMHLRAAPGTGTRYNIQVPLATQPKPDNHETNHFRDHRR